uniref:Uncharacterized protein n=1 Tax=Pithovirus LCPAC404 TaxID=2506597 RepID=A0A481ZD04_9VIRU|nr:MAG: hypothetical protein LCPAC404_03510 [Pithovirus LCPAC404]
MDIKRVIVDWMDKDEYNIKFTFWCNVCKFARRIKTRPVFWDCGVTAEEGINAMFRNCECIKCKRRMNRSEFDQKHQWKLLEATILHMQKSTSELLGLSDSSYSDWTIEEDEDWKHNPDSESEEDTDSESEEDKRNSKIAITN